MTDNDAVLAVIDSVYEAWAAGDADRFVASYAPEATAVLPGAYLPNREAIRAAMKAGFAGPLKGTRGIHDVQDVRFVGGTAIVISKSGIVYGPAEPDRTMDTWVLSDHAGTWRVEAFHNSPLPAGEA